MSNSEVLEGQVIAATRIKQVVGYLRMATASSKEAAYVKSVLTSVEKACDDILEGCMPVMIKTRPDEL